MGKTPVAIQLYVLRGAVEKDLAGTLAKVAGIGYEGAEPWGYGGTELAWMGHPVADIRKMYDDNGLICCGIHLQTGALMPENIKTTIEFNRVMGNRFLIIAADGQRMKSREGINDLAGILNTAAETLRAEGMFAGYHAHGFDFDTVEGEPAWNHLFRQTRGDVIMQMDNGNCMSGGGNPIAALTQFPGRTRTCHLKDWGGPAGSVIGEGTADWASLWRVLDTLHRPEWYVVEEGGPDGADFEIPARSLAALRAMGR